MLEMKQIYKKMNILEDKLHNWQEYDREDLLKELNEIGEMLFNLPLYNKYRDLSFLYMEIFDAPLFAEPIKIKGE